jgi:hypothetical protein
MYLKSTSGQFHWIQNRSSMRAIGLVWVFSAVVLGQSSNYLKPEPTAMPAKQDFVIYADNDYYASFPEIILTKDQLVVYFNRQKLSELRASNLHPHYQPVSRVYYAVSRDWGKAWSCADQSPDLKDIKATTGSSYVLSNNQVLEMTFRYIPGTQEVQHLGPIVFDGTIHRNPIFKGPIEQPGVCTKPFLFDIDHLADGTLIASGYGDCGDPIPTVPAEGELFKQRWPADYRTTTAVFFQGSPDGRHWRYLSHIVNPHVFGFSEPAITVYPGGRIIAILRTDWENRKCFRDLFPPDVGVSKREGNIGYYLYQMESLDNGKTWSEPVQLPIWGHPANMVQLKSGNLLMVYGYRRKPQGFRAVLSRDEGRTWDLKTMKALKVFKQGGYDLGYPVAVQLPDGRIFCCGYGYSTEDVGEKMPHGIFGTIFKEEWLLQEQL